MSILEERLTLLETVTLDRGAHDPDGAFCVMELAAHLAGERWSDSPDCVSPVIAAFLRSWNDQMGETDRQILKPLIPMTIGTRTSEADELARSWMAVDWLARECAPAWLRLAGLISQAEQLEQLAPLLSPATARTAQPALDAARAAAGAAARAAAGAAAWDAAWAAAGDAARDAAWAAAGDAARAAAGDAARAAAGAAAWDAAWAAAGDAAWAAARAALQPTVKILQASALRLVERMCQVGR